MAGTWDVAADEQGGDVPRGRRRAVDLENLVELADAEGGARYEGLRRAAGMR
jgi:hypothetical protein